MAFAADLLQQKGSHFGTPFAEVDGGTEVRKFLLALGKVSIAGAEYVVARGTVQREEESDTKTKGVLGGGVLFVEFGEAAKQFVFSFCGEGLEFASLAALTFAGLLLNPAGFAEFPEQGINQVVVESLLTRERSGALF